MISSAVPIGVQIGLKFIMVKLLNKRNQGGFWNKSMEWSTRAYLVLAQKKKLFSIYI